MRFSSRLIASLLLAAGAAACTDTRTINSPIPAGKIAARLSVNPVFSPSAKAISATLADFGITFDHVRVSVRNLSDTSIVVFDTTVAFGPTSSNLVLNLTVPVTRVGEAFNTLVQYLGASGAVYAGEVELHSYATDGAQPEEPFLALNFVGPGAKLKTLTVSPKPVKLVGSATAPLTITAADSSGASITVPPIVFTSSDETIAKVNATGTTKTVQSFGKRGQARITATTPTGITDTLSAVVTLPAASVAVISGGDQTGTVGTQLAQPIVVQVSATDGAGVADVPVVFAAGTGASVGTTTATTDVNGRASTTFTLSTTSGSQAVAISAGSLPAISASATARPAAASAATSTMSTNNPQINADNQTPSVITVSTKDQYGNVVFTGGATVILTTTLGHWGASGTATTTTATDNANGTYSATLFSAQSGTAAITGTVGGIAIATAAVTVTAVASVLDHFDVASSDGTAIPFNRPAGAAVPVRIRALDVSGNVVASYNSQTVLSVLNSTLIGGNPTIVAPAAVAGVINTTVVFGQPGQNVRLVATGATKTGQSAAFSVVAGAAAVITPSDSIIIYGMDQTPQQYPSFFVTDAGGNITGRQTVSFTVTGPCRFGEATTAQFTSDTEGAIIFNASMISIPTVGADFPFSCQITGTGVGFTAATPARTALLVQPSNATVWTGHTNGAWETRDNWTNDVPSSTKSAFIAAAQPRAQVTAPVLNTNQFISSIDVEDGTTLNLNGHTLGVSQNIDTRTSGLIAGGTISASGNGGLMRGTLPTTNCQNGVYSLIGQTTINGALTLNCIIDANGNFLSQNQGAFATTGGGGLIMNASAGRVEINGDATFGGTGSQLSDGQLYIYGSLHQLGGATFPATNAHGVFMFTPQSGAADESITFNDVTNSFFSGLVISMAAGHTFTISQAVQIRGSLGVIGNGGTLALPAGLFNQRNGRIDLAGPMTASLGGTINAAALNFNSGAFTLTGNGTLSLGNGTLFIGDNVQLVINVTGNLVASPVGGGCTHGVNVSITGSNTTAVAAVKQACGIP
ncbi:MAG TPA: Ig-like domain-containing protein [Gemmatimonadaceae bacterium]|jgi:adhesin/invasin